LVERQKLSDGGHETRRLQLRRPAAVRRSAWLNGISINQVRTEIGDLPVFDLLTPLVQLSVVHLPEFSAQLEMFQDNLPFPLLK
jgi:hypothetical protein